MQQYSNDSKNYKIFYNNVLIFSNNLKKKLERWRKQSQ